MFIQNPDTTPADATWLDFDRLQFDTGAATLRPESQEQIANVAAILLAYPSVNLKVGGFTDNIGNAEANFQLSRDRANAVVAALVKKGVAPDRLAAEGYGEQQPLQDNSTEEGRAKNRRVSMRITRK
jgi:K(+)-stimulated pyrophosphate-energized sodium pump